MARDAGSSLERILSALSSDHDSSDEAKSTSLETQILTNLEAALVVAVASARAVLASWESVFPHDLRPHDALAAAEACIREPSVANVRTLEGAALEAEFAIEDGVEHDPTERASWAADAAEAAARAAWGAFASPPKLDRDALCRAAARNALRAVSSANRAAALSGHCIDVRQLGMDALGMIGGENSS